MSDDDLMPVTRGMLTYKQVEAAARNLITQTFVWINSDEEEAVRVGRRRLIEAFADELGLEVADNEPPLVSSFGDWCNCQGGPQGPWHPIGEVTCRYAPTDSSPDPEGAAQVEAPCTCGHAWGIHDSVPPHECIAPRPCLDCRGYVPADWRDGVTDESPDPEDAEASELAPESETAREAEK